MAHAGKVISNTVMAGTVKFFKTAADTGFASRLVTFLAQDQSTKSLFVPKTGATLTPREVEVLHLLTTGASNRAIATELVVSLPTVKTHVSRILGKLNVQSQARAAAAARDLPT